MLICVILSNFPGRDCTDNWKEKTKEAQCGESPGFRVGGENQENTEDTAGAEINTHSWCSHGEFFNHSNCNLDYLAGEISDLIFFPFRNLFLSQSITGGLMTKHVPPRCDVIHYETILGNIFL